MWLILFVVHVFSATAATSSRNYYIAAVLEHRRLGDPQVHSPEEIVRRNLNVYTRATHVAKSKGADIIVFPELGIFPPGTRVGMKPYLEHVPDPKTFHWNPCCDSNENDNRTMLKTLSCLARNNHLFLVANVADVQQCSERDLCPDDGIYQYNTNVVFDRDGTLITRYHKVHLFYEDGTDSPLYPQDPVFSTDFGTFATYICFDVWFKDIVDSAKRVDNIAFPTMWFNTMPILNSLEVWQAFAATNKVNFLASNIQFPNYGNTGSGIFTPVQGAIKYTLNNDGRSKLIVSKVPISSGDISVNPDPSITLITENSTATYSDEGEGSDLGPVCDRRIFGNGNISDLDYRCLHDNTGNYTFVRLTQKSDNMQLCQNGMCCSLNYSTTDMQDTFYLGVHNQTYSAGGRYFWCLEACVVLRCEQFNNRTCSTYPLKSQTIFYNLELKANFTTKYIYPSVLKNRLRIANHGEWSHSIEEVENGEVLGQLGYGSDSSSPLVVAALSGRCYNRDPPFVA